MSREETLIEYAEPLTGFGLLVGRGAAVLWLNSAAQSVLAVYAYTCGDVAALSLLAGLRLGDAVGSHSLLSVAYKRDNPGIFTASPLVVEAWLILASYGAEAVPFFAGFAAFVVPWSVLLIRYYLRRVRVVQ